MRGKKLQFEIGQQIKEFIVLSDIPKYILKGKQNRLYWFVRCKCGNEYWISGGRLNQKDINFCCAICAKRKIGKNSSGWEGIGEIPKGFITRIKRDAKRRSKDIEYNIRDEYLWELFLKQNRQCALSGITLIFGNNHNIKWRGTTTEPRPTTASLDRINSSKGYIDGNVWWVHKDINIAKMKSTVDDFTIMCENIVNYKEETQKLLKILTNNYEI